MTLVTFFVGQLQANPVHVVLEVVFAVLIAYLLLAHRRKSSKKSQKPQYPMPSLEEQERRLAAFASHPFREDSKITSNVDMEEYAGMHTVQSREGWHTTVSGGNFSEPTVCVDLATFDYHSFSTHPEIMDLARKTVMAYGVGSCGPRGFYGTIKPHLVLEEDLARFCGTGDAIIYSFGYATVSTLISCYCGRGDYIVADEGISSATEEGCVLTRAHLTHYAHNDTDALESQLKTIVAKENPKKPKRRFVVTEGVFKNSGDIAKLPEILELCKKYKFRLILEDSYGFGAIGKHGRGTPEHFGIPISDVDIYVGSLSTSLGGVGGFCAGDSSMIDYQRLGAAAYVFSASLPPYVTACCSGVLALMDKDDSYVQKLHTNTKAVRTALRDAHFSKDKIALVECVDDASPVVMLTVAPSLVEQLSLKKVESKLQKVVNAVEQHKILILRHLYATDEPTNDKPSLRIVVKGMIPETDLNEAINVVIKAIKAEFA